MYEGCHDDALERCVRGKVYAKWFYDTYLVEPWCNWFVTASGVPGVKPDQNPQESAHKVMKASANGKFHSSTEYCINSTIPEMMANHRDATNHSYVAESGPLPN